MARNVRGRVGKTVGQNYDTRHDDASADTSNPKPTATPAANAGKQPLEQVSLYRRFMTDQEWEMVRAVGEESLAGEIWVARLVVARFLAEGDLKEVTRVLGVVKSLVAEHRKTTGDQAEGIVAGIQKILDEFQLGEGDN